MKKIIALTIVLILLLILFTACGKAVDNKPVTTAESTEQTTETTQVKQVDTTAADVTTEVTGQSIDEDLSKAFHELNIPWNGSFKNLTADQKKAIEGYYKKLGKVIQFTDDGGMIFKDDDGTISVLVGKWPKSALLNNVPKPDFGTVFKTEINSDEVSVVLSKVTKANYNDYVGKVKSAGFNKNPEANSSGTFYYAASNSKGLNITIVFTGSEDKKLSISVTKG